MDVLPTQQSIVAAANAESQASSDNTVISSDFETFLSLLTAQMQNQDPLNPIDSTEFASQLAQFSGVEQQVRTNDLLETLSAGISTLGMGELGGWIGMQARAEMPVYFEGQPVTLSGSPHIAADRMELVVYDQNGEVVQEVQMPLSSDEFEWDGSGDDGELLPYDTYSFTVRSWDGETLIEERNAMVYATIQEAQVSDGDIWVTMTGGLSIPAGNVLGIRNPDP